jgi:hypothetical protein
MKTIEMLNSLEEEKYKTMLWTNLEMPQTS